MSEVRTMLAQIKAWAQERPDMPALHQMADDGGWDITTWSDYWTSLRKVGKGLISLGIEPGQSVAIVGNNRPEWVISQHGITAAGAVPGPLYTTLLTDQMSYIISNCEAPIAICDNQVQLDKLLEIKSSGKTPLKHIVTMDEISCDEEGVLSLKELMKLGEAIDDGALDARIDAIGFDDLALLIYTSGTTGLPKGAMLTHRSIDCTTTGTLEVYSHVLNDDLRYISYLPLCHAAEQALTNFCAIRAGGRVYFCGDIKKVKEYLLAVRPTAFFAVPRVWEKFEAALRGRLAEASGIKAFLADWSRQTEKAAFDIEQKNGSVQESLKRKIANKLVINKIKTALGLDSLILAASGAAPISRSTLEFFASIGIAIYEGFGMTETTSFATLMPFLSLRFGTIGKPFPGVEVKIAKDSEIMLRGDNMIKGYLRLPEKTAELYDDAGWMHTGDLGAVDDEGYLRITGRKKDILITAGGKNVAPAEMESHLQGIAGVGQAVVVGDRQPYLAALLILDPDALPELAKEAGLPLGDLKDMASDPKVRAFFEAKVESECNKKVARYQTIKKFEILDQPFSVETGELTPTMKVKRNVVNEIYASKIAGMYGQKSPQVARA